MSARGKAASLVDDLIMSATTRFCEKADDEIRDGKVTADEVRQALIGYPDFEEAWDEWTRENG